jgi:hypothetical protein
MPDNKELWIDLHSLITTSSFDGDSDCMVADYHYERDDGSLEPCDDTLIYKLRIALRAVGHKITKISSGFNTQYRCVWKEIYTTVNKSEWEESTKLYNTWVNEVCVERYEVTDTDEEEEEEEQDDDQDENPN